MLLLLVMKTFVSIIQEAAEDSIHQLYGENIPLKGLQVVPTKPEFEGDYTVVFFSLLKQLKKRPDILGNELGGKMLEAYPDVFANFNVIKGFLNFTLKDKKIGDFLSLIYNDERYGSSKKNEKTVMVEFASPNTNKPLHLGHLRNIFLGWSMSEILKANGYDVVKSCIVNDRGIHICKSMIAWQRFADGATPKTTGVKGDHFVGDYYVKFNDVYKKEVEELIASGVDKKDAEKEAPIMKEAQEMLRKWEDGDAAVRKLWREMNGWVYEGFDMTYDRLGVGFDKVYYESDTYLEGKQYVQEGLEKGVLFQKEDKSIWIDLANEGLDEKLLLRGDGTSVYMTQDIGLAKRKFEEYPLEKSYYVIGDEQNYHMKVLRQICAKLGFGFSDEIYHVSYGMVELTTGKMKSREGTVVDADDIVDEMLTTAREETAALGKVTDFTEEELAKLYRTIGLGAVKFFLLRVDPKKRMVFDPKESIDFHGFTGPFVQYTYARIRSILRKAEVKDGDFEWSNTDDALFPLEKQLILQLENYQTVIKDSATGMDPSLIANYVFSLAKLFNSFYTEHSVLQAETPQKKTFRLALSMATANVIAHGLNLLGIDVPERM